AQTVTGTTVTITGLTNGTVYEFRVLATNAIGDSGWSATVEATPANVPAAPTGLTATGGDGEVVLSWTAPAGNGRAVTGYKVQRQLKSGGSWGNAQTVTGTTVTITGLTNGTVYQFRLRATNAIGDGGWSSTEGTPGQLNVAPLVVPGLRSWVGGFGGLVLTGSSRVVVASGDKARHWSGDWFSTVLGGLGDPDAQGLADDVRAARRLAIADSKWAVPHHTSSQRTLLQVAGKVKADLKLQTGLDLSVVVAGENGVTPAAGDVVLNISDVADSALSAEGYELAVTDRVVISANSSSGVFYGSRTLLQVLALSDDGVTAPRGTARDWPAVSQGVRMVHSDVSRTFWEPSYLADSMREMSWAKLNTYYWHLSESSSFRLHDPDKYCKTVNSKQVCLAPSGGRYSKADVDALVAVAAEHHIAIVPGIDVPGHADPIADYLGIAAPCDTPYYIDMSAKAWTEVGGLITHFGAWFPGPYFGLGGDEVFGAFNSCSTTTAAIQRVSGVSNAGGLVNRFLNDMGDVARGLGKRAMVYSGFEKATSANVSLSTDTLVMPWDKLGSFGSDGYDTVNLRWVPHKLYLVLGPRDFDIPLRSQAAAQVIPSERTNEIGTGLAVWGDASHWADGSYVEGLLKRPRAVLGDRLWANAATADVMSVFEERFAAVGRPPGYVGFPDVRVDDGSPSHYYTFDAARAAAPSGHGRFGSSSGLGQRFKFMFDEIAGRHGMTYGASSAWSDRPRIDTVDAQVGDSFEFYSDKAGNNYEFAQLAHADIAPPWTMSVWVKRTGSQNDAALLSSLDYRLYLQTGNTNKVGVFNRNNTPRNTASTYTLPLNIWVYLTFVGSATDTKIYANGVLQDTLNVVVPLPRQAIGIMGSARFHRDHPDTNMRTLGPTFKGKVDELKMWDQTLTANEILARYESYDDPSYEHLAHLWTFDDGAGNYASDIGRRHNAGAITGASWQTAGVDGGAIRLDGTGDWIHTGADPLPAADGWTAALWVKRTALNGDSNLTGDGVLFAPATGTTSQIKLERGATDRVSIGGNTFAYTVPEDTWTHLTLVGDNSSVTLYVNGANPITVNAAHPLVLARIGAKADGTQAANTWLDDIRIYNTALNATRVKTLYDTKVNVAPLVVPGLRSWVGGFGGLVLSGSSRVVVAAGDKGRYWSGDWFSTVLGGLLDPDGQGLADDVRAARRLALADSKWAVPYFTSSQRTLLQVAGKVKADLKLQTGLDLLVVVAGENGVTPAAGDVVLNISDVADSALSAEGYELAVTDRVVISANSSSGVFYGSRTLLQVLALSDDGVTAPRGTARDWPAVSQGVRMVHSDVSRTFWEPSYLADSMREMSWMKLNTYYWHLSERNSFRLHDPAKYCKTVSGEQVCLATPKGYYTKADVDALVAVAAEHHIAIVPGIDVPGHADPISVYFDISSPCYGTYFLDMSAKAWTDVGGLIKHFGAWFPGPYFSLGGDEVNSQFNSCSTTTAAISRVAGVSTAGDLVNKFLNDMGDIVRGLGKRSMVYSGFEGASSPNVSLSTDTVVMPWDELDNSGWNGYDTVNLRWVPHKLYLVLGPRSFDIPLQSKAQAEVIPLERTNEIGTGIAVWADASHWAEGAYIEGLLKRPRALLGDRLWANTATADEMDVFEARLAAVGRPPGYVGFPDVRVDDGSPSHYYTFDASRAKVPGEYIIGAGSGGLGTRLKIAFDEIAGAHGQAYGPNSGSYRDRPRIDTSDAQVGDSFHFYSVKDNVTYERLHFAHADIAPPWTVSAWVKRTGSENNATLLSSLDYRLHLQTGNTNKVGVFNRNHTPRNTASTYTLPLNTWVYLTFVGSATNTKIYANGVLQDTLNVVVPLPRQAMGIMSSDRFNRDHPGASGVKTAGTTFKGKVDELKMWDQALTTAEVLTYYESYDDPAYEHLVHLWSLDDGAGSYVSDIGRRHTAGTITGASWQTTGVDGGAISLDGAGDWIHTGADSLPAADGWTAALWVKRSATTGDAVLFAPTTGSAGQIKLETGNANRISIGGNTFAYTAPADQWTHLTLVGDSSSVKLYVNGANPITVNTAHPLALARIGAKTDDTLTANTWLDDIRIYNKTLNATEIRTLFTYKDYPSPPGLVSGLSAVSGAGRLDLSWVQPVSGGAVSGYDIAYKLSSATNWGSWARTGMALSVFETITGLTDNSAYDVRVRATGLGDDGGWVTVSATPMVVTAPGDPMMLTAVAGANESVVLSWTLATSGGPPAHWEVQSQPDGGSWSATVKLPASARSHVFASLMLQSYELRVRAVNSIGQSSWVKVDFDPPFPEPLHHWTLDEGTGTTAADTGTASTTFDGTLSGATWTTQGRKSGALSFDGSSDWLQIGKRATLPASSGWTAALWVKRTTARDASMLFSRDANRAYGSILLETWGTGTSGSREVGMLYGASSNPGGSPADRGFGYSVPMNTWTHLVFVGNSTDIRLYADGVLVGTLNQIAGHPMNLPLYRIGTRYDDADYLAGDLDDIRAYDIALDATQVQTLYDSYSGPPGPPGSFSAVPGKQKVDLSWSVPTNDGGSSVTGYKVQYRTKSGGNWMAHSHSGTGITTTVTNLTTGTTYEFQVRATNAKGDGAWSTTVEATPAEEPAAPVGLTATAGAGEVVLSWSVPTNDGGNAITGYQVRYREEGAGGWSTHSHSGMTRTATVINLTAGTVYEFRVRATNAIGNGAWSSKVKATPLVPPNVAPLVVPGLRSWVGGFGGLVLSGSSRVVV
ncbi:MAG: family 20 glycosylhydrolase, partial [Acidimicrobiia bacterium]|nr:family 20 glycosylhydrolase [Acidimicrobiia bacterium]